MGLAPATAAPGDKIVIVGGGKSLTSSERTNVQAQESRPPTCTFLGDSYVHSIMEGEVIESL